MEGDSAGIGELAASGAENRTAMVLVPLTPVAPADGVTETTRRAAAGSSGFVAACGAAAETREAWLPGEANATIITPAAATSAAPLAVRAMPRFRTGFETPEDRQNRFFPPEVWSLSGNVCGLRNRPDPDTELSPPCDRTIGQD
jgi:hypothetical protein